MRLARGEARVPWRGALVRRRRDESRGPRRGDDGPERHLRLRRNLGDRPGRSGPHARRPVEVVDPPRVLAPGRDRDDARHARRRRRDERPRQERLEEGHDRRPRRERLDPARRPGRENRARHERLRRGRRQLAAPRPDRRGLAEAEEGRDRLPRRGSHGGSEPGRDARRSRRRERRLGVRRRLDGLLGLGERSRPERSPRRERASGEGRGGARAERRGTGRGHPGGAIARRRFSSSGSSSRPPGRRCGS